jgi:hypothetical protein
MEVRKGEDRQKKIFWRRREVYSLIYGSNAINAYLNISLHNSDI